ncbi:hypothetical protein F3J37_01130 [Pantoea sp. Al-1710]|uniref:Uncharacterized protein n=1 Tax=Candidatus Pantoea communis TaxID=2608354 RepID=A0ABX0RNH4_9GAMM|nr:MULTISPECIES: hypothetical protein [Pantoea]NIG13020.1 hypothetical protein [Pantoea sp. Cy-640]NIG17279.1 hypothetical protein [Pantoea communis]
MKHVRLIGSVVACALVVGVQIYYKTHDYHESVTTTSQVTTLTERVSALPASLPMKRVEKSVQQTISWNYHFETDKLRHETKEYGSNASLNQHKFAFPYNRGAWLNIQTVSYPIKSLKTKDHAPVKNVFLTTTDGQFDCGYDGCSAVVSFDGGKVETFHLEMVNGNPNNVMLITDGKRFMKELKQHKMAIIEVDYYMNGSQQFTFHLNDEKDVSYRA